VGSCFVDDFMSTKLSDIKFQMFADYLTDNYIDNNSLFPPYIWAVASSSPSFTTNACESIHSKFNSEFYHPYPQIFSFIKVSTDFQTDTYIKLSSLHIIPRITSQTCQRTKQMQAALDQYNSKLISSTSFIELVAYKYKKRVSIKTVKYNSN
jgi:hypothetical protein